MKASATAAAQHRSRRWKVTFATVLGLALALGAALVAMRERIVPGAEACLYGFPLVIMDLARAALAQAGAPADPLQRVRAFPAARFHRFVRPNVGTLYSAAFIDMGRGPWLFEMPADAERHTVMPFMDA